MADQPDIDLGSVGYRLIANTDSLERSLTALTSFGELVNRATRSSNDLTEAWARTQRQTEKALTSQFTAVERLNNQFSKLGLEGSASAKTLNTEFEKFTKTMSSGWDRPPQEIARGFSGMQAEIARAAQQVKFLADETRQAEVQQKALFQAQQRTASIVTGFNVQGAPQATVDQARLALMSYEEQLNKGTLTNNELTQANQRLIASLNATTRAWREEQAAAASANVSVRQQMDAAKAQQAQQDAIFQRQERTKNFITSLQGKSNLQPDRDTAILPVALRLPVLTGTYVWDLSNTGCNTSSRISGVADFNLDMIFAYSAIIGARESLDSIVACFR